MRRIGRVAVPGAAKGSALVLAEPLSFWGGIEPSSGRIIDRSHPDLGRTVAGRILVMPGGRGSSSSSSVLAECLRRGTGPAGIVLGRPDPILAVGCVVARELYRLACPLVVCPIDGIATSDRLLVEPLGDGRAALLW